MSTNSTATMGRLQRQETWMAFRADRTLLRLSATLLFAGELLSLLAGIFHPEREPANHHSAVFAEYASSAIWTAVHLGQFAGMMIIIAGLLVLFFALNFGTSALRWAGRFGAVSAVRFFLRASA